MKNAILALLVLAAMPLAFAQTWCEQSCCENAGGSWDPDYESCDSPDSSYYDCMNSECEGYVGGSASCCGSAFILAAIGFGAYAYRRG
ncbi:MAG: hypothetical protein V1827_03215 [Candidatus Micrarchaeota archaeon]